MSGFDPKRKSSIPFCSGANYRYKRRQASSYLSILRPRRRLASPSRRLRSPAPT